MTLATRSDEVELKISNSDGSITDLDKLTWQVALLYCEDLDFAGHSDWRLPNERELQSIVDYGRFDPAIDPVFGAVSSWYWSSSTVVSERRHAWRVHFRNGFDAGGALKTTPGYLRAVRGGP